MASFALGYFSSMNLQHDSWQLAKIYNFTYAAVVKACSGVASSRAKVGGVEMGEGVRGRGGVSIEGGWKGAFLGWPCQA